MLYMAHLTHKFTFAILIIAATVSVGFAQQAAPASQIDAVSAPAQGTKPANDLAKKTANNQALAQPAYLTPIGGTQGVLAETLDGSTIASQAADERFNPASSVKLATALVALQNFGPDYRFVTGIWTVTGKLIVAPGFTMNFDWSVKRSGEEFRNTLDAARRSDGATRAWLDERTILGDNSSLSGVPSVVVKGEILVDSAPPGATALLTHKSSKLVDVLKALLCYSNNFMAERIGETLGGPNGVSAAVTS